MSFAVQVNETTAASASGTPTDTGKLFITGVVAGGNTQAAQAVHSIDEFTGIYSGRSASGAAPLFDAVDGFFGEAGDGAVAYVGGYLATGHYTDGLALLADRRYGPGQLSLGGAVPLSAQVVGDVIAHCSAYNRIGLLDVANGDSVAQMTTDAGYVPANTDLAAIFGSWCQIPGPVGVIGAGPRTIPASAIIAALCKRVDDDGNPNRAAGGYDYALNYAQGFVLDPNDHDRSTLLGLGVNTFTNDNGVLINAGFRTNIPSSAYEQTPFWQFNAARARMWLKAQAQAIGAPFYMRPVDGRGKVQARLQAGIEVACNKLWQKDGLYGETPQDAYKVSVSLTPTDAGQGLLTVTLRARYTMHAEAITINLVSIPVTTAV